MLLLFPTVELAEVMLVLLLELFAVYMKEMAQLYRADGVIIQTLLLKKARTLR